MTRDELLNGMAELYGDATAKPYPLQRMIRAVLALRAEGIPEKKIVEYVGEMEHGMYDTEEVYSDTLSWSWVFDAERFKEEIREFTKDSIAATSAMLPMTVEQKEQKIVELFRECVDEDESGDFVSLMIRQLLAVSLSCPDDEFCEVQEIEKQYVLDFPHLAK